MGECGKEVILTKGLCAHLLWLLRRKQKRKSSASRWRGQSCLGRVEDSCFQDKKHVQQVGLGLRLNQTRDPIFGVRVRVVAAMCIHSPVGGIFECLTPTD